MFYCHGWPSSRLEAGLVSGLPLRLVAADRPGYGLSDPHGAGTLKDRAQDLAALADHLGLQRFPIVGVSGGGPLAAACAFHLPDRVAALCLISAVPPPHTVDGAGLGLLMRLGRWPIWGAPALRLARQLVLSDRFAHPSTFRGTLPPSDARVLTPLAQTALVAAMREGFRTGAQGALDDARLYGRPWGFDLAAIRVSTAVWHGTRDQLVDVTTAQAFAVIPGVEMHILDGQGHYGPALGETAMILEDLLRRA